MARSLGLRRAADARAAFLRAVRSLSDEERPRLLEREVARLDQLEVRIRDRDRADPEKLERRLAALEVLRRSIAQ